MHRNRFDAWGCAVNTTLTYVHRSKVEKVDAVRRFIAELIGKSSALNVSDTRVARALGVSLLVLRRVHRGLDFSSRTLTRLFSASYAHASVDEFVLSLSREQRGADQLAAQYMANGGVAPKTNASAVAGMRYARRLKQVNEAKRQSARAANAAFFGAKDPLPTADQRRPGDSNGGRK